MKGKLELSKKVLTYSGVPITRAGSKKRGGWKFHDYFQNEQDLISASRVEKQTFSLLKR